MYSFPNLEPVRCTMSVSNCCLLTCIQISQEAGKVVWYSHLFKNFPQFVVIYTAKGFQCSQLSRSRFFFSEIPLLFLWSNGCWQYVDSSHLWILGTFQMIFPYLDNLNYSPPKEVKCFSCSLSCTCTGMWPGFMNKIQAFIWKWALLGSCQPFSHSVMSDSVKPWTVAHQVAWKIPWNLEWVAIPFSRGSSWPGNQTWVSCIVGRFFTIWATREAP